MCSPTWRVDTVGCVSCNDDQLQTITSPSSHLVLQCPNSRFITHPLTVPDTTCLLLFSAHSQFFTRGAATAATCLPTQQFPALNEVTVLGLQQQRAPANVTIQVGMGAPTPVAANAVSFDAAAGTLMLMGLNQTLSCPEDVAISWA